MSVVLGLAPFTWHVVFMLLLADISATFRFIAGRYSIV